MTSTTQLPSVSIQDLIRLSSTPGTLRVTIKQVNGYFLPVVHFRTPHGDTQLHGIVVDGESALATIELADLVTVLEELIGSSHDIVTPDVPIATTLH